MNPNLIAISGSIKGKIFALTEDETSVGREASNSICLNDLSVSRRHCVIRREPASLSDAGAQDDFTIVDLESYNGTFVNGLPVKEQKVSHGDQILGGEVLLLLLRDGGDEGFLAALIPDEANLITRSTIRLRPADALYLCPEKLVSDLPAASARTARDLGALLKISSAISSIRNLQELHSTLFKLILEVIPAEREAIFLSEEGQHASICGWNRLLGPDNSIKISSTITNQVLREGVALLSNDLIQAGEFGEAQSLVEAHVCSVLCVPLIVFEKTLGVIYLDTSDRTARFDEHHLQLLTAIACISAAAFQNVKHLQWIEGENERLQQEINVNHQMIGESQAMQAVSKFIGKVVQSDSTVLIRGESGTGKELAARAIHTNSPRASKPFIAINGATLSETLLESELFGHEKGAFTGAIGQKRGKLELANGGTLFLDEVGELTPVIQAKLLRVLQEREFERVGGIRPLTVDLRVVAATNKNLEDAVAKGIFRQDLYYRLNVVSVTMPPLTERRDDIQLLASYFCSMFSKKCKRRVLGISPEARAMLRDYDWPGNVRELQNVIERAVVLGSNELITPEDLPDTFLEAVNSDAVSIVPYHERVLEAKRLIIMKTLEDTGGNRAEAARRLGLYPANLHRLIRDLKIKR